MANWNFFRYFQVVLFMIVGLFKQNMFDGKEGDAVKLINFILFSFGNGYLQTLAMIKAP